MTQNAISTYGDMWILKEALEKAGKADREAVAEAMRTHGRRPVAATSRAGEIKFDDKGRRVGAGLTIIQWQTGVPVTVYPPDAGGGQADLAEELSHAGSAPRPGSRPGASTQRRSATARRR